MCVLISTPNCKEYITLKENEERHILQLGFICPPFLSTWNCEYSQQQCNTWYLGKFRILVCLQVYSLFVATDLSTNRQLLCQVRF